MLVAALWGFAEATLFFVVPDVFLTLVALRDRRAGLLACGAATAGAVVGGLLMYLWGRTDAGEASAALLAVPGIGRGMIQGVRSSLDSTGLLALFLGPLSGTPYKIYAVMSGDMGLGLAMFLVVSVPARGVRFIILTLATSWVSRRPLAAWTLGRKRIAAIALWIVFYALYFAAKGRPT